MSLIHSNTSTVNVNPKLATRGLIGVIDPLSPRCYVSPNNHIEILRTGVTGSFYSITTDESPTSFVFSPSVNSHITLIREIVGTDSKPTADYSITEVQDPAYMWANGSIGFWINIFASTREQYIFDSTIDVNLAAGGTGKSHIRVYKHSTDHTFFLQYVDGDRPDDNATVNTGILSQNTWHYVVFTWQRSGFDLGGTVSADGELKCYVNGEEVDSLTRVVTGFNSDYNLAVGNSIDSSPMYIGGFHTDIEDL